LIGLLMAKSRTPARSSVPTLVVDLTDGIRPAS
jgi:hypothetical protein